MIIHLMIILIVVGAALYIVRLLPIDAVIKQIIYVLVIVFLAIYVLQNLGSLGLR